MDKARLDMAQRWGQSCAEIEMQIAQYKGYALHMPDSGGKAGKGRNKTSTIQVRNGGFIAAQFRFDVFNAESRRAALRKAREWCDAPAMEETFNDPHD